MTNGWAHRHRQRRPLLENEVRYEKDGLVTSIYRRKGPDWQEYCQLRVTRHAEQQTVEGDGRQWAVLMKYVNTARLQMAKESPSALAITMYLAHTIWGWELSRIARVWGVHRTMPGKYVKRVEDARDDPEFDAALTALE